MITSFPVNSTNPHYGSLIKFYFIPVEDIATEPEIYNGQLIGDYTFNPGKEMLLGYFDRDSAKFSFEANTDAKGNLTKAPFVAELSDNSAAFDSLFCDMRCKRFIVWVIDNYKNVRVMGRKNAGAKFDFSFSTTSKIKTAPSYSFNFYCENRCVIPVTTTQITDIC